MNSKPSRHFWVLSGDPRARVDRTRRLVRLAVSMLFLSCRYGPTFFNGSSEFSIVAVTQEHAFPRCTTIESCIQEFRCVVADRGLEGWFD